MTTSKLDCLTHMLLAMLLACTVSRAEDSGGTSRTGGRDQPARAVREKQHKHRSRETDRQTADKKRHADLIKEDKGT